jgi:hypothetical protein
MRYGHKCGERYPCKLCTRVLRFRAAERRLGMDDARLTRKTYRAVRAEMDSASERNDQLDIEICRLQFQLRNQFPVYLRSTS